MFRQALQTLSITKHDFRQPKKEKTKKKNPTKQKAIFK